jgi:predicted PurR-regulated permease PerM
MAGKSSTETKSLTIANGYRFGLLGGLGVLTALLIGGAITTLAQVITYVFAAIFIALGLDPIVTRLEKLGLKRPLAILAVILVLLGIITALLLSVVPQLISEANRLISDAPNVAANLKNQPWLIDLNKQMGGSVFNGINALADYLSNSSNWPTFVGGFVQIGLGIFTGLSGFFVILILSIYFMASLTRFKKWVYSLVPASTRPKFSSLAEQISVSVGRYVMGQVTIAVINATCGFIMMSILGVPFAIALAFVTFLLAMIPLVGSLTGALIVSTVALTHSPITAVIVLVYYLLYMQFESYVVSPRVMREAVSVPGAVVVIAALAGGALLGVLGALVAIPVAASIMLIIRQVWIPRQNER